MSDEQHEYPPCPKCRTDEGRHPECNDPASAYFQCPVRLVDCQQCLAGDRKSALPRSSSRPPLQPAPSASPAPSPDAPTPPGILHRAYSYAEALARWTAAGQPVRPDKEVERIFNDNCKTCKWFDPKKQICRGCGCRVAVNGVAVLNKIKMATEHCPRELW